MLDLANFEVVGGWLGQKKAQIGQNKQLHARFGSILRWLGKGKPKTKENRSEGKPLLVASAMRRGGGTLIVVARFAS